MLSENLKNLVSSLSSTTKTCDMNAIGIKCMHIARRNTILEMTSEDHEIERILERIACEPLNDKLSLNPRIFAAQNQIQAKRKEVANLERYHDDTKAVFDTLSTGGEK